MSAANLHLLLDYLPILGIPFGILLLAYARWRRDAGMTRAALGIFVAMVLVGGVALLTGEPAPEGVDHVPGATHAGAPAAISAPSAANPALVGITPCAAAGTSSCPYAAGVDHAAAPPQP